MTTKPIPATKTVAGFKAIHDKNVVIPNKIRAGLAAMLAEGPETWEYEAEFEKRIAVSTTDFAKFRAQFADYIVETAGIGGRTGKRAIFATVKAAKQARE